MKNTISKNEYIKLLRISNTQLKNELKKPAAEQDLDLISECVESIAYYENELAELKRSKVRSGSSALASLRKVGAALLVLIVSFAVFATVSEAAGFRVWTAIIKRDAGYLRIDYVPEPTAAPVQVFEGWDDGEYSFFSIYDFNDRLRTDGFTSLAEETEEYEFLEGSIRSTVKDYYATYTLRNGSCTVRVRMIAKALESSPVSVWGMDAKFPYYEGVFSGVKAAYQTDDEGCVFATWQSGGCIFSASIFEPEEDPARILELIVR